MGRSCPSCGKDVPDTSAAFCQHCGWQFSAGAVSQPLVKVAARPKVPANLVLAVDIDRTGSSLQFQEGIYRSLQEILPPLSHKVASLKIFTWTHGDLELGENPILLTDGGTPEQALADVGRLTYAGGGDLPETHLDAMENVLQNVPWTLEVKRTRGALVAFMTSDTKPAR